MRRLIGITVLGLFAFTVFVYSQSSGTKNPLTGAWKVTEIAHEWAADYESPARPVHLHNPALQLCENQRHEALAQLSLE